MAPHEKRGSGGADVKPLATPRLNSCYDSGTPTDKICEMEARRLASIEPATRQASCGGGTGAVGGSHGSRRADTESAS
jgi:hypothetical protein